MVVCFFGQLRVPNVLCDTPATTHTHTHTHKGGRKQHSASSRSTFLWFSRPRCQLPLGSPLIPLQMLLCWDNAPPRILCPCPESWSASETVKYRVWFQMPTNWRPICGRKVKQCYNAIKISQAMWCSVLEMWLFRSPWSHQVWSSWDHRCVFMHISHFSCSAAFNRSETTHTFSQV